MAIVRGVDTNLSGLVPPANSLSEILTSMKIVMDVLL